MSPLLQEKAVYVGQLECYELGCEVLEKLTNLRLSTSQLFNISNFYGSTLLAQEQQEEEVVLSYPTEQETIYVELDGSMVLTREDSWNEVKLGRIFSAKDCLKGEGNKPGMIRRSHYVSHLGGKQDFIEKMERVISQYNTAQVNWVFISDGATWIKNWIQDSYGDKVISILDFYHASEYLHEFARAIWKDEQKRAVWVSEQKSLLLGGKVAQVIHQIDLIEGFQSEKEKILRYYTANQNRMDYAYYQSLGIGIIGSGAIESAHRTVIQKRMKLSGQRWSKKGAKNILKLRTLQMNQSWDKVIELAKKQYQTAA